MYGELGKNNNHASASKIKVYRLMLALCVTIYEEMMQGTIAKNKFQLRKIYIKLPVKATRIKESEKQNNTVKVRSSSISNR